MLNQSKDLFVDDDVKHKKSKGVYTNVVERINQSEYKDDLLNRKCFRHLMNIFQSSNCRIGTYEINKILLSCLVDKVYIPNNGYHGLALGY